MTEGPIQLAVIGSSVREGRLGPMIAEWFVDHAKQQDDVLVDYIDLALHPMPYRMSENPSAEDNAVLERVTPRLESADAFVLVTPEYNHSFPASLKHLIDWHSTQWRAKPVGFVSYGGLAGGLRAVEQLRPILGELHAVALRDTVSFPIVWEKFDDAGQPTDRAGATEAADKTIEHLLWWGRALREARRTPPAW